MEEEGRREGTVGASSSLRVRQSPTTQNKFLIVFVEVCVKTVAALGRDYPWQRPAVCPRCGGVRVWGHGFVGAYFDEAGGEMVMVKRYRCPECRVVIRLRPTGYFRRIQASIAAVRACVAHRLGEGRWPPGSNSERQRHWLRGLRRQVLAHLGMDYGERLMEGFEELVGRGICAVSRSV